MNWVTSEWRYTRPPSNSTLASVERPARNPHYDSPSSKNIANHGTRRKIDSGSLNLDPFGLEASQRSNLCQSARGFCGWLTFGWQLKCVIRCAANYLILLCYSCYSKNSGHHDVIDTALLNPSGTSIPSLSHLHFTSIFFTTVQACI